MIAILLSMFALLFGAVLLMEVEESLAQLQTWVRSTLAQYKRRSRNPDDARKRDPQQQVVARLGGAPRGIRGTPVTAQDVHESASMFGRETELFATASFLWVDTPLSECASSVTVPNKSEQWQEVPDDVMRSAGTPRAAQVFRFPRAAGGLQVCIHPPGESHDTPRSCDAQNISLPGQCTNHRELLRTHEGYCRVDDRLLRFDANGRQRSYELWDHSKWRPARREIHLLVCSDDEDEGVEIVERVEFFTYLDINDEWVPVRRGDCPGWRA
ncbi:hypothetical protein EXIGLDRAFT_732362 [Exidia glandulosa HHB12029]|uniref:Uncharacterized protein n=1 Tax=Exidia glandulosa HHB12029 TaxID=1314781 RepID=A0A165KSC8_EXIGL|nr:hypothetical protein EXIGLDRAFT_732362 [Exidia glandulosa HHB12029]